MSDSSRPIASRCDVTSSTLSAAKEMLLPIDQFPDRFSFRDIGLAKGVLHHLIDDSAFGTPMDLFIRFKPSFDQSINNIDKNCIDQKLHLFFLK